MAVWLLFAAVWDLEPVKIGGPNLVTSTAPRGEQVRSFAPLHYHPMMNRANKDKIRRA